jgi:SAM-dependent methyltransferase
MNPSYEEGYNVQTPYVHTYRHEYAPNQLQFAALAGGFKTGAPTDFRYLELGCGQGYGLCVLAALYPEASFFGVDMMAEHIASAQSLADSVGLSNANFQTDTFRGLLARLQDFGSMDFVVLHGVYSWVDDVNRSLLIDILRRIVKPGGIVYISYNAMPGGAGTAAVQQLVMEHLRQHPGQANAQAADSAIGFALELADAAAGFFKAYPQTLERTRQVAQLGGHYVAHEYTHAQWTVLSFGAVARAMHAGDLTYAGPAQWRFSLADLALPPTLLAKVEAAADPIWRETLIGFVQNTQFRADVFVRATQACTAAQRQHAIQQTPVLLFMEDYFAGRLFGQDWGVPQAVCRQWLDLFSQGPVTLGTLFTALDGAMEWDLFAALVRDAMVRLGSIQLARTQLTHTDAAARLNSLTMRQRPFGLRWSHLLYPAIGTAIDLGHSLALMAELSQRDPKAQPAQLIEDAMTSLEERQQRMPNVPNDDFYPTQARRDLARFAYGFGEHVYPFLRRAGLRFDEA